MRCFLSFVVVSFNNLSGLKKTIPALLEISDKCSKEIEIIIIDGYSDDGSLSYMNSFKHKIRYLYEIDNGIYDAMNKGIKLFNGKYLSFMNSGDHPIVKNYIKFIENITKDHCYYGDNVWYPKNTGFYFIKYFPHLLRMPNHQAMIFNRNFIKKETYNESYKYAADLDLKLKCLKKSKLEYFKCNIVYTEIGGFSQNIGDLKELISRAKENSNIAKKYFGSIFGYLNFIIFMIWHIKKIFK